MGTKAVVEVKVRQVGEQRVGVHQLSEVIRIILTPLLHGYGLRIEQTRNTIREARISIRARRRNPLMRLRYTRSLFVLEWELGMVEGQTDSFIGSSQTTQAESTSVAPFLEVKFQHMYYDILGGD